MADEPLISAAFDSSSLAAMAHFSNFSSYLVPETTGELADTVTAQLSGPMEVIVSVGAPQAKRLEYGFGPGGSEMADSLGRIYHQKEEPYANPALQTSEEQIALIMDEKLSAAFIAMGV